MDDKKTREHGERLRFHRDEYCTKCRFQKRDSNLAIIGSTSYSALRCPKGFFRQLSRFLSVDNTIYAHSHHESIVIVNLCDHALRGNWWSAQTADASDLNSLSC